MKHVLRTQCQYHLQHRLFTDLSDLMMRRRAGCQTPIGRLSVLQCTVAYPWRLYDMLVDLARDNISVLVGAGDNLHQTLVAARQYTIAEAHKNSKQTRSVRSPKHVPLRAPTWLHARVLLAGMIVLEGNIKQAPGIVNDHQISECRIDLGFSLTQLAEGCDTTSPFHAELLDSIGNHYLALGKNRWTSK